MKLGLFGLILHALGGDLQLPTLVAYFPLCAIGSKVPVAVLGLGVRETLVLLFLAPLAAPPILLATSLIHSILAFILPPLLMSLFTWKLASRILR